MVKITFISIRKQIQEKIDACCDVFVAKETNGAYTKRGVPADIPKYRAQYINEVLHDNILHLSLKDKFGITDDELQLAFKKYTSALAICKKIEHKSEFDEYICTEIKKITANYIKLYDRFEKLSQTSKIKRLVEFPPAIESMHFNLEYEIQALIQNMHSDLDQLINCSIDKKTYTKLLSSKLKLYAKLKHDFDFVDNLYKKHINSREYKIKTLLRFNEVNTTQEKNIKPWSYSKCIFYLQEYCRWRNITRFDKKNVNAQNKISRDKERYNAKNIDKKQNKEERNTRILELFNSGKSKTEIATILQIARTTIHDVVTKAN